MEVVHSRINFNQSVDSGASRRVPYRKSDGKRKFAEEYG